MGGDDLFAFDPDEPLAVWSAPAAPPPGYSELRAFDFELTSRGDRVPGRLLLPPQGDGPFPAVLLQHGAGGSKESPYLDAAGGPWARRGAAVASIDFPLHGARADAKLSALVQRGFVAGGGSGAVAGLVLRSFAQAVVDLRRATDALAELPGVDAGRLVYAGFSLGTIVGATFCGIDPRPRAAALAIGGGGMGPAGTDPTAYIGRFAPRPVLFVNATNDATIPRAAAEALYAAAGEPKQIRWFESTHSELPGAALKAMWEFLAPHLGLGAPGSAEAGGP